MAEKVKAPKKTGAALKTFIESIDAGIQDACGHDLKAHARRIRDDRREGNMLNIVICAAADAQKDM